jgi:exodeoxyribonuclease VII small subunit
MNMPVSPKTVTASSGKSFKEAFGVLQNHADTLRNQDEPNIDDLLAIVTESVAAYKVCKERIDAVEAALKAALDGAGVGPTGGQGGAADPASLAASASSVRGGGNARMQQFDEDLDDDEIPF